MPFCKKQWPTESPLVIFDELHKYPRWKSWIKGVYDTKPLHQEYLVTGSARLDVYRRGGDSLIGTLSLLALTSSDY